MEIDTFVLSIYLYFYYQNFDYNYNMFKIEQKKLNKLSWLFKRTTFFSNRHCDKTKLLINFVISSFMV